jgi:thiol:disulfide interchange protein
MLLRMRTLLAMLAIALVVFGCSESKSEPPARSAPAPAPEPEKVPSIVVSVHKGDGELSRLLAEHSAKAKQASLDPYLEFTADWCKPCVEFKKYLGDPMMKDALAGTYIVMVDFDAYSAEAGAMGITGIPTWLELDDHGKPTGRTISSGVWEEDIPANMAPPLKTFFAAADSARRRATGVAPPR